MSEFPKMGTRIPFEEPFYLSCQHPIRQGRWPFFYSMASGPDDNWNEKKR